jgi:hypothetical protein
MARHAQIVRRGRSGSVGGSYARVVLRATPTETNARVSNRITLHLVDGHLGCVTMNELNEATALARRDLDVCNFAKALEERPELIFSDIAGQTTNENSSVVGVRELVHLSGGIETTISEASLLLHSTPHLLLRHASAHHGVTVLALTEAVVIVTILGGSSRNAHGAVAAVHALHLHKSTLLVVLIGETNETVATALTRHGISHDLGTLAAGEAGLEKRDEDIFVDLGSKVANEDGVFGTAIITVNRVSSEMCSRQSRVMG